MKSRALVVHPVLAVLAAAVAVPVAAIQFETGEWEVTMQSRNPVTGQEINETTRECIQDRSFDPAKAMLNDDTCRITDKQESGDTVTWKMECGGTGGMPVFHGAGSFTSHGNSAEGEMKVIMNLGGNTLEMSNRWHGKRISSSCSPM